MASVASQKSQHPFLTPGRASNISSWTSTLPNRRFVAHVDTQTEAETPEATIEAYRRLKTALFSRATKDSGVLQ